MCTVNRLSNQTISLNVGMIAYKRKVRTYRLITYIHAVIGCQHELASDTVAICIFSRFTGHIILFSLSICTGICHLKEKHIFAGTNHPTVYAL